MNHSIILRRDRLSAFSMDALFLFNEERQVGRDIEVPCAIIIPKSFTIFTDRKIRKELSAWKLSSEKSRSESMLSQPCRRNEGKSMPGGDFSVADTPLVVTLIPNGKRQIF